MPTDGSLSSECRRQVEWYGSGVAGHCESLLILVMRDPPIRGGGADNVVVVDNQDDVRDFLASRRARITPRQAALPAPCW